MLARALPPPWTSVGLDVRGTGKDIRAAMQAAVATEPDASSDSPERRLCWSSRNFNSLDFLRLTGLVPRRFCITGKD
jgi:hypothetical protein